METNRGSSSSASGRNETPRNEAALVAIGNLLASEHGSSRSAQVRFWGGTHSLPARRARSEESRNLIGVVVH